VEFHNENNFERQQRREFQTSVNCGIFKDSIFVPVFGGISQ